MVLGTREDTEFVKIRNECSRSCSLSANSSWLVGFREAGALAEAKRTEIEADMRAFFETQEKDETGFWVPTSSWLVTARNPG
ncbi:MAG: hypothetical protein AAFR35_01075 [Pseudomonadota bacterium]